MTTSTAPASAPTAAAVPKTSFDLIPLALVPLLLGLGMDELSVGASLVPRVKRAVQSLTYTECQQLVEEVMQLDTGAAILTRCTEMAQRHYGDLLG